MKSSFSSRTSTLVLTSFLCLWLIPAGVPSHGADSASAALSPLIADGLQKLEASDADGAVKSLDKACKDRPDNASAWHWYAVAALSADRPEVAARAAEAAMSRSAPASEQRALDAFLLGKARLRLYHLKLTQLQSRYKSLPDMVRLLSQMSVHHYEKSDGTLILERGDLDAPDDFQALQASLKDGIRQLDTLLSQAKDAFYASLGADAHIRGPHDGLGQVSAARGENIEARREFETEIDSHGTDGAVVMHLAELEASAGNDQTAIDGLRQALSLSPRLLPAYNRLAEIYARQNDPAHVQWARGMAALLQGKTKEAVAAFDRARPETPAGRCDLLRGQALLALTNGKTEQARSLLSKGLALMPHDTPSLVMQGDLQEQSGDNVGSMNSYHQAVTYDPFCDAAWHGIGLIQDRLKNFPEAMDAYQKALKANPNNPLARMNLAADQADAGRIADAAANLREYLQRFPLEPDAPRVQDTLAQLLAEEKKEAT